MNSRSDSVPPPPSTRATQIAGLRFAIGLGAPLLAGAWVGDSFAGGFAAMGAMFALGSDTRSSVLGRLGGIALAVSLLMAAGLLGSALRGNPVAEWAAVALIVFLTGLPGPTLAFLGYVGKFAATAVVLVAAGFPASPQAGAALLAGVAWAALITVADAWIWHTEELGTRPLAEIATVFGGSINSPVYALMLAVAVLLGTFSAAHLGAMEPGWVGLTVLFVMHVNDSVAFKRIVQRIVGTLAGFALAALIVPQIHSIGWLALLIALFAFFFPITLVRNYLAFSFVVTVLILLVIDVILAAQGGDQSLLRWRVYDTVLGAAWAALGLLAMRGWRWLRSQRSH